MADERGGNSVAISDIREWLVRIDTNQQHQTQLLEALNAEAKNTYEKADKAEDIAEEALALAKKNRNDFDGYRHDQVMTKRWMVGTVIAILAILAPIIKGFYS